MPTNNSVEIEPFAASHFVKSFEKKYKQHWNTTLLSIIDGLERIEFLLQTNRAETICIAGEIKIIKTQFRIDGTKESAKSSGNRCIVAWHTDKQKVAVLLVYCKTDIVGRNETAAWKSLVRKNYVQYSHVI